MNINGISNQKTHLIQAMKALEMAAKLPQQLTEEVLSLQNKMLKANVTQKMSSSKIDTYA